MITRCPPHDVVSSPLHRSTSTHRPFRLWGSSFFRKIINSVRCGGAASSSQRRPKPRHLNSSLHQPTEQSNSESGSVKLSDLFKFSSQLKLEDLVVLDNAVKAKKNEGNYEEISKAVRLLQEIEEREFAVKSVRRLAKENAEARVTLARFGAIPPLVEFMDDDKITDELRVEALYALLNLGIGNHLNKAAIVKAGAVHKMLKMITSTNGSPNSSVSEAIVANFLALSASDSNKPIIGSSGAIPFLVSILKDLDGKFSPQSKQDSLKALYNLSILPSNIPSILETDLIRFLMNSLNDTEMSERILSILSNIVAVPEGRKALSAFPDAFPILIDTLSWNEWPGCQEKVCYILMVMAHKGYNERYIMIEAGIVTSLLELTLIGTTLAQKRASRILQCLRVDKGKNVGDGAVMSAPIHGDQSSSSLSSLRRGTMSDEKRAVKNMVKQSLQNNMRTIAMRANMPQDFVYSEHLKSFSSSSTSKSLPF